MAYKKKLIISIGIIILLLASSSIIIIKTQILSSSSTYVINTNMEHKLNGEKSPIKSVKIIKESSNNGVVLGWMGNNILFQYFGIEDQGIYSYNPSIGKKELVTKNNGYDEVTVYIPMNTAKVLFYKKYGFYDDIENFLNIAEQKKEDKDYGYFGIDNKENLSDCIEIFDFSTKKSSIVDEFKTKWRVLKDIDNAQVTDFQDAGWSNDGNHLICCKELKKNQFQFTIYNVFTKEKKIYTMTERKKRFDFINKLTLSNDCKRAWFMGSNEETFTEDEIYQIDFKKIDKGAESLIKDVAQYEISPDNKILIYLDKNDKLYSVDLSSMEKFVISEKSMYNAFHISPDGKKIAFLEMINGNAKLYIADMDKLIKKVFLYKFNNIDGARCIQWNLEGNKILFSYYSKDSGGIAQTTTNIVELNE